MDELLSLKWKNHTSAFLHQLATIREKQFYTDVTLACSGKFYSVHKMVLTACSDYFKDILEHLDFNKPVIVLNNISNENLEALLDYMYVGEVSVRQSSLSSLIKSAECLHIKGLAVADEESAERPKVSAKCKRKRNSSVSSINICEPPSATKYTRKDKTLPFKKEEEFYDGNDKGYNSYNYSSFIKKEIIEPDMINSLDNIDPDMINSLDNVDKTNNLKSSDEISNSEFMNSQSTLQFEQDTIDYASPSQVNSEWLNNDLDSLPSQYNYGNEDLINQSIPDKGGWMCKYCSKVFHGRYFLRRHLRIHSGERPYSCHLCSYSANQRQNLRRHVMSIHDNTPSKR